MDVELRHLRILEHLARTGSIRRTAGDLGLPQPAVSRILRRIEQSLDAPLFERGPAGIVPTAEGRIVLLGAAGVRDALTEMRHRLEQLRVTTERLLRVGTDGVGAAGAVAALEGQGFDVDLVFGTDRETVDRLESGALDLAAVFLDRRCRLQTGPLVDGRFVASVYYWAYLHREHPLAGADVVPLRALERERWLLKPAGTLRLGLEQACDQAGFAPCRRYTGPNEMLMTALAEGRGVTLGDPSGHAVGPAEGVFRPPDLEHSVALWVLWRTDTVPTAAAEQVAERIRAVGDGHTRSHSEFTDWLADSRRATSRYSTDGSELELTTRRGG